MEEIVEELDENFASVLKSVFDGIIPDNTVDSRQILRMLKGSPPRMLWGYVRGFGALVTKALYLKKNSCAYFL